MSSIASKDGRLAPKLMLSTALVALSVSYAWYQDGAVGQQKAAALAALQMQAQASPAPAPLQPQPMTAAPDAASEPATTPAASPDATAQAAPSNSAAAAPTTLAMAAPQAAAPAVAQAAPQPFGQPALLPAAPVVAPPTTGLTGMAAIRAFIPTEGVSPPLPPISGTPDPGAAPVIAAGTHLEDGDYESDRTRFEWGDLRARIVITGGKITTVQIMSYPDHRSQSLYLIQLADPILISEVIKSQQTKVQAVSSATASSYAFMDAVANAELKATRGS